MIGYFYKYVFKKYIVISLVHFRIKLSFDCIWESAQTAIAFLWRFSLLTQILHNTHRLRFAAVFGDTLWILYLRLVQRRNVALLFPIAKTFCIFSEVRFTRSWYAKAMWVEFVRAFLFVFEWIYVMISCVSTYSKKNWWMGVFVDVCTCNVWTCLYEYKSGLINVLRANLCIHVNISINVFITMSITMSLSPVLLSTLQHCI